MTVSCRHIAFDQLWVGKGFVYSFMFKLMNNMFLFSFVASFYYLSAD
ncbi:hypothetical protein VCRA2116O29_530008 [Vibrio crassostreae]|nr:hypothetical protein VCRA2119O46_110019 [Vibrio crassostreae]CAK1776542.1 hypothetical protein VCRA2113O357_150019 [Vibrio crassostreae]CAK1783754.1 hypothetical protein VCRA2113O358_150019 [Vibrio crassostreae]CAK2026812.1 hypothetical protein VCRA2117O378_330019 [Vibrio crassostreae]CAK2412209.1 hypothetical protein VCRA2113O352_140019 [Vibrio crassostreae]